VVAGPGVSYTLFHLDRFEPLLDLCPHTNRRRLLPVELLAVELLLELDLLAAVLVAFVAVKLLSALDLLAVEVLSALDLLAVTYMCILRTT